MPHHGQIRNIRCHSATSMPHRRQIRCHSATYIPKCPINRIDQHGAIPSSGCKFSPDDEDSCRTRYARMIKTQLSYAIQTPRTCGYYISSNSRETSVIWRKKVSMNATDSRIRRCDIIYNVFIPPKVIPINQEKKKCKGNRVQGWNSSFHLRVYCRLQPAEHSIFAPPTLAASWQSASLTNDRWQHAPHFIVLLFAQLTRVATLLIVK